MLGGGRQLALLQMTNWNNNNNNNKAATAIATKQHQHFLAPRKKKNYREKERKNERLSLCWNENFYLCQRPKKGKQLKKTENWKEKTENWKLKSVKRKRVASQQKLGVIWRSRLLSMYPASRQCQLVSHTGRVKCMQNSVEFIFDKVLRTMENVQIIRHAFVLTI